VHRIRLAFSAVLVVAATLAVQGPAFAGGPTSALLSVPGSGATASLYYTDADYDRLAALIGVDGVGESGGAGAAGYSSGAGHENGPGVTVTWLIHDVMPWRVDRIYLSGPGAPWIASQVSTDGDVRWNSPVSWHQPSSGPQLVALLDKLGVGKAARTSADVEGVPTAAAPTASADASSSRTPALAQTSNASGIWWGLGGLVAGLLVSALWVMRRRSAAEASIERPEQADRGNPPDQAPVARAEELSWP
jgi:hypothetical protein